MEDIISRNNTSTSDPCLFFHLLLNAFRTLGEKTSWAANWRHILLQLNTTEEAARELKKTIEDPMRYLHGGRENNGDIL